MSPSMILILALERVGRGLRQSPIVPASFGPIEPRHIEVVVEAALGLGDDGLAVAIGDEAVDHDVPLVGRVVHQEDVVREVQLVVGITQQVVPAGGQFLELVDEVVAQGTEQAARDAEGLAGQAECKCHGPQHVHLIRRP
jgi:hypothetical protein